MISIPPNPLLGVSYHSAGALLAANCYAPQKYVRGWSWEIFWMTQAAWCWLLWPIVGACLTIPELGQVLAEAPKLPMLLCLLMGVAYGVGGTAFNISIRYIGFSLTYAIAVGLSSILGTLVPPLAKGEFAQIFAKTGANWVLAGIATGVVGIALCGIAGRLKELDLRAQTAGPGEFSLFRGLLLSLLAGVLSAVYGIATDHVSAPVVAVAAAHDAGIWKGNVAYLLVNPGAFLTAFAYSLFLARKNRSLGELAGVQPDAAGASLPRNYLLAILTGTLWYAQFFCYNLGHVRMGNFQVTSWAIHMIMLVLFSNLTALLFREWKGCRPRTLAAIFLALNVLMAAVVLLTYGNYLGEQAAAVSPGT